MAAAEALAAAAEQALEGESTGASEELAAFGRALGESAAKLKSRRRAKRKATAADAVAETGPTDPNPEFLPTPATEAEPPLHIAIVPSGELPVPASHHADEPITADAIGVADATLEDLEIARRSLDSLGATAEALTIQFEDLATDAPAESIDDIVDESDPVAPPAPGELETRVADPRIVELTEERPEEKLDAPPEPQAPLVSAVAMEIQEEGRPIAAAAPPDAPLQGIRAGEQPSAQAPTAGAVEEVPHLDTTQAGDGDEEPAPAPLPIEYPINQFDPNGGAQFDDRLIAATDPLSIMSEEYRSIRTGILARWQQKRHLVHLITSATPQEGKTISSLNLGLSFAELRMRRTIVVEADLRLPQFAALLGLPQGSGIIDVLEEKIDLAKAIVRLPGNGLHVLPAGGRAASQAVQLLSNATMVSLLKRLRQEFDHIIIDTPPVVQLADAGILGSLSDDVLLVVRLGRTPQTLVEQAVRTLSSYNAPVAGLIATDDRHYRHRNHYKYEYRYGRREHPAAA
jgi:capsular exopolysaccharide synthesis family protein